MWNITKAVMQLAGAALALVIIAVAVNDWWSNRDRSR